MYEIAQVRGVFLETLNFQKFRVCPLQKKKRFENKQW